MTGICVMRLHTFYGNFMEGVKAVKNHGHIPSVKYCAKCISGTHVHFHQCNQEHGESDVVSKFC